MQLITYGLEEEGSPAGGVQGRLDLAFESQAGRTFLRIQQQAPPLRVIRAFPLPGGGTLTHLHNLSGGVLSGDRLEMKVHLGCRALAQLTTTGATRLYRCQDRVQLACQSSQIQVGENALLEYLPDPLIPFAGSRYRQNTVIDLAAGAGLLWWEIVAPGREAMGEVFQYHYLETSVAITAGGYPLALERACLEPALRPLTSPARLGSYRYYATFYMCRVGLDEKLWPTIEARLTELAGRLTEPGEILWGASLLPAEGLVVRAVSRTGRAISAGLLEMWRAGKREIWQQEAVVPRKIY